MFLCIKKNTKYSEKIKNIWKNLSLKQIGLPSGSNDEKPDVFYANNDKGKENAILFTLATLIAYYFNNKIITNIIDPIIQFKFNIIIPKS